MNNSVISVFKIKKINIKNAEEIKRLRLTVLDSLFGPLQ